MLPDVLEPGLNVVFCGTAVARKSAAVSAYYAGPGNRFWKTIAEVGLVPLLQPKDYQSLLQYGLGLSDLSKTRSGNDGDLRDEDYDIEGFKLKILRFAPRIVAFNGKEAAKKFLKRKVNYGRQSEKIGDTVIFVLPSTSAAARGYWDTMPWQELADCVSL